MSWSTLSHPRTAATLRLGPVGGRRPAPHPRPSTAAQTRNSPDRCGQRSRPAQTQAAHISITRVRTCSTATLSPVRGAAGLPGRVRLGRPARLAVVPPGPACCWILSLPAGLCTRASVCPQATAAAAQLGLRPSFASSVRRRDLQPGRWAHLSSATGGPQVPQRRKFRRRATLLGAARMVDEPPAHQRWRPPRCKRRAPLAPPCAPRHAASAAGAGATTPEGGPCAVAASPSNTSVAAPVAALLANASSCLHCCPATVVHWWSSASVPAGESPYPLLRHSQCRPDGGHL